MTMKTEALLSHTDIPLNGPLTIIKTSNNTDRSTKPHSSSVFEFTDLKVKSKHLLNLPSQSDSDQFMFDSLKYEQLDQQQFDNFAFKMEQARARLNQLLLNNSKTRLTFAKEYILRIEQGYDQSELFSLNYDMHKQQPIQEKSSVQVNAKQFGIELYNLMQKIESFADSTKILAKNIDKKLSEIHFLPIFLQYISAKAINSTTLNEQEINAINTQLSIMLESRQVLINSNVRMVAFVVKKYEHSKIAFSDLMQEGTIGLIKAVDRFDYLRPVRFSTYAVFWIKQMISRATIKQKKLVPLPFNLASKVSSVFSSLNTLLQENNKWPNSRQLAESCDLSIREVEAIMESYKPCLSLSSHINDDEDSPILLDTLEQEHFESPLNELSSTHLNNSLQHAIDSLQEREAFVIRNRFGINSGIELTLQEIADQFQVSKERIRQIQNTALNKLKQQCGTELSDFLINDPA